MTSQQWKKYFDFSFSDQKRTIGVCKLCKRSYKDLHGIYSNFLKHLRRIHAKEYNEISQGTDDWPLEENRTSIDDRSPAGTAFNKNKSSRISLSIAKELIIRCNLPLGLIENSAFRSFLKECYPKWEPMSTKKLKKDIIPSFKNKVNTVIEETLHNVTDLTLTVDGWCDRRGRAFLGMTCHFLNEQFIPKAYLIDFLRIKSPHTSDNIQNLTEQVLDRFNVKQKVFRIVTDNAASMVKAYKFGLSVNDDDHIVDQHESMSSISLTTDDNNDDFDANNFHFIDIHSNDVIDDGEVSPPIRISCFAHSLQLSIRDGLRKAPFISKVLEKCQTLSRFCHKSSKAVDLLESLEKNVTKSNATRWNSEFLLIKSVLSIGKNDSDTICALMDHPVRFSSTDFVVLAEIVNILEPFHDISVKCQAEVVATVSLVVPSITHLLCHLRDIKANLSFCHKLVDQLSSSITQRFGGIVKRLNLIDVNENDPFSDSLYFMATLLDPMFKFQWIRDLELSPINENRLKHNVIQSILDQINQDSKFSSVPLTNTTNSMSTVPSSVPLSDTTNSMSTGSSSVESITPKPKRRKLFDYGEYDAGNRVNGGKTLEPSVELEAYLNDPVRSTFSDYWVRSQLSSLKKLVLRIFSVQASSAPIERVFSQAGLIFSNRRTNMTEQLFRDLVFLKVNQFLL